MYNLRVKKILCFKKVKKFTMVLFTKLFTIRNKIWLNYILRKILNLDLKILRVSFNYLAWKVIPFFDNSCKNKNLFLRL